MRALVIDDEQLVLEGLEAFLQAALPELSLDKTADVNTALQLAASVPYELLLLDWHLVDQDGHALDGRTMVQGLRAQGCKAPILVVSGDDRADWPALLFELGLSGVVTKSASGARLVDAIQIAIRGGIYLPAQTLAARANPRFRPAAEAARPVDPKLRYPDLTERQVDVFRVMVRGLSDKQIARELGITEATVKTHVRAILGVVGVRRRGEAVFEVTGRGAPGSGD
jgi:two-component system nitrate/nitrite response regulator NarL